MKALQREGKEQHLKAKELGLKLRITAPDVDQALKDQFDGLSDAEKYWRISSRGIWWRALLGEPYMRDYNDWLTPHMRGLPSAGDWMSFWLFEAPVTRLPRDFVIGACAYYQERDRIEAGNAGDMLLAVRLLDADALVTADRRFHRILQVITTHHGPFRGEALLVDQQTSDFRGHVKDVIREADQRRRVAVSLT
jgi:hypothetical protein